jgi:hypothetical protein
MGSGLGLGALGEHVGDDEAGGETNRGLMSEHSSLICAWRESCGGAEEVEGGLCGAVGSLGSFLGRLVGLLGSGVGVDEGGGLEVVDGALGDPEEAGSRDGLVRGSWVVDVGRGRDARSHAESSSSRGLPLKSVSPGL